MKVMNNNIINYQGKVDMPKSENVGYLIEHLSYMEIRQVYLT